MLTDIHTNTICGFYHYYKHCLLFFIKAYFPTKYLYLTLFLMGWGDVGKSPSLLGHVDIRWGSYRLDERNIYIFLNNWGVAAAIREKSKIWQWGKYFFFPKTQLFLVPKPKTFVLLEKLEETKKNCCFLTHNYQINRPNICKCSKYIWDQIIFVFIM